MNQEDYNICIREIFSILTQGIDVTMYETNIFTLRSSVKKQTIWMVQCLVYIYHFISEWVAYLSVMISLMNHT